MNAREELKRELIQDTSRRVVVDRKTHICEGQLYLRHKCSEGIHMHEVIFTRNHFRHIKGKGRNYFWNKINCSLVCGKFHRDIGHTKDFNEWWVGRVIILYGLEAVRKFIRNVPLKVKGYNYVMKGEKQ
jgi:hypothetical protein